MEIIDIECVLLSFLSEKFVATKWRIYKGILTSSRLLREGFLAVPRSAICLKKDINSRLCIKKRFRKRLL